MVKYWKTSEAIQAKVTKEDGVIVMHMDGEKYTFPGFPRGYLLYGKLSKLKHEIKNQIFNDSWKLLEENKDITDKVREVLPNIFKLLDESKYDMLPPRRMVKSVREIHRAWTKVSPETSKLRDLITFILQEDDSYRFRFQWTVMYLRPWIFKIFRLDPIPWFKRSLVMMEHAEMIGDMKERARLFRRVILALLEDEIIHKKFIALFREIKWRRVKMSKADKYFFRGKYFKVDLDKFDY